MTKALHLLIVEDSASDAGLTAHHIEHAGYEVRWERVDDRAALEAALDRQTWDVILCDFTMPDFNGTDALALVRARGDDIPFIFVSGTMGEDVAVEAMRTGAHDYVVKGNLKRLVPAIERELREAEMRRRKRKAEQALVLHTRALEATANAVVITSREGLIEWVNPAFTKLTGYNAAEVLGQNLRLLRSGQHETAFYAGLWRTILAGQVWRGEMINRRKGGKLYTEENTITPVQGDDGRITHFISVKHDISGRKQAEDALHRSEAELRWKTAFLEAQVNSSLDGILVVNGEGKKILQNQRTAQLWNLPPEIASGTDDRKQLEFVMQKVKNPQAFVERAEYLYAHRDAVSRDEVELTDGTILDRYSSAVLGKDGTYYGRVWTFRDMTAQRQLEAELRHSQKMDGIGQLAGGIAHDFNNMLAVIRGNAELLLMEVEPIKPEAADCINQVIAASERAATLTRQLLIFSRKQVLQSQPLALNDLVKNLIKMLKRTIREDIRLECAYADSLPSVQADPGMLEQVLLNLVVNARDAMPGGGEIRIETEMVTLGEAAARERPEAKPGTFVCLRVSDTGTGIAPEHLPRIFDPFFTTKEPGKGTGLGLATVYGIVKQHGGWVEVSSQVGRGTTLKVCLPALPQPTSSGAAQPAETKPRGGTETILLVEDDYQVRIITRRVLEAYGYNVHEAASGREALRIWNRQASEIALLLSDIVMPDGLNGRDLAEQLRTQKPGLRVVFMSGYSAEVIGKDTEFFRRTKTHFLHKPCAPIALAKTVRQALDED